VSPDFLDLMYIQLIRHPKSQSGKVGYTAYYIYLLLSS